MLGHKQPLSKSMLGHKKPLGKNMLGHKAPLMDAVAKMESSEKPMEKKSPLERRIPRGLGWKLGMYA